MALDAQVASYQESDASNIAGDVLGFSASYTFDALTLGLAVNRASNSAGKTVDLGLGGGNFYASMAEMTIAGLEGASAQVVTADYAFSDNFTASLGFGHFEDKNKATTNTSEIDVIVAYNASEKTYFEYIYMLVDNKAQPAQGSTNFARHLLRMSYTF